MSILSTSPPAWRSPPARRSPPAWRSPPVWGGSADQQPRPFQKVRGHPPAQTGRTRGIPLSGGTRCFALLPRSPRRSRRTSRCLGNCCQREGERASAAAAALLLLLLLLSLNQVYHVSFLTTQLKGPDQANSDEVTCDFNMPSRCQGVSPASQGVSPASTALFTMSASQPLLRREDDLVSSLLFSLQRWICGRAVASPLLPERGAVVPTRSTPVTI